MNVVITIKLADDEVHSMLKKTRFSPYEAVLHLRRCLNTILSGLSAPMSKSAFVNFVGLRLLLVVGLVSKSVRL